MPERIIFALQKGGVGKTTSTVSSAEILAAAGHRVLVADMGPQGNATRMLTGESIYNFSGHTIMEAIRTGDADPYVHKVKENLDLIPAEDHLAAFSRYIYTSRVENPYAALKRLLEPVEGRYDFVFVDVGPTLGDTLVNAIVYADHIIIPVDLGDLAMDAMVRFMEFVDESRAEGHTTAKTIGILLTMKDGRTKYEKEVADGIRSAYGDLVFDSEIHRRVSIKEMSASGVNLEADSMNYYFSLVEEIINRIGGKTA